MSNENNLEKKIEAILFFKAEELSTNVLQKITGGNREEIKNAVQNVKLRLEENTAFTIIENNQKFLMAIKPEHSDLISQIKKEEEFGELSHSALETLSIILYKGPVSKADLDDIRGVNSSFILRNLSIRGLVEKINQQGQTFYQESISLLQHLGVTHKKELPSFEKIINKLDKIEKTDNEHDIFTKDKTE